MKTLKTALLSAMLLLAVSSCAGLQRQVSADPAKKSVIVMKASDFKFTPNNIRVYKGQTVVFRLENTAKIPHDFTLKDPSGRKVEDVDLPPGKTVDVTVFFRRAGRYNFYCDIDSHKQFGMWGRVEVLEK